MATYELDLSLINQAAGYLENRIHSTPIEFSPLLSERLEVPVYFKLEFLQVTGSFKVRGALFYLSTLSDVEKERGVAACSSGNHGLGVAHAANEMGIDCTIYVPKSVEQLKVEKILKLGAKVRYSEFIGYDDTLEWAIKEANVSQQHLITAFDDGRIMAGNGGSLGVEILNDVPSLKNIVVPVGGGGLSSGLAFYLKSKNPAIRMIGCQHSESPAFSLSLKQGKAITRLPPIETLAGGIEGGIGEKCFEILKSRLDEIVLLSEQEIIEGVRWTHENQQYLIEPTAATAIAACLSHKMSRLDGPTLIVLTGRNISYMTAQRLIA